MTHAEDCLTSALANLKQGYETVMHAVTPGAPFPDDATLRKAAKCAAEAHLQLEHLLAGPDPYADKVLRQNLNRNINTDMPVTVGDAAARGMIAKPEGG